MAVLPPPPPPAAFLQKAAYQLGNAASPALGIHSTENRESGTYCKLYILFQQLDWGLAIGSVAVNPVFVFSRYASCSFFYGIPLEKALMGDGGCISQGLTFIYLQKKQDL